MKRRVNLLLWTVGALSGLVADAAVTDFVGYAPENLAVWAKCLKNEVNLRKTPSSTSPRLCIISEEEEDLGTLGWESKNAHANSRALQAYEGDIFPIFGITPDKEWFNIVVNYYATDESAWIKSSFCEDLKHIPITDYVIEQTQKDIFGQSFLALRTGGRYNDLCLYYKGQDDDMAASSGLFLGKLIDGNIILPIRFDGRYAVDNNINGVKIKAGNGDEMAELLCSPSHTVRYITEWGNEILMPDLRKLTDEDIDQILENSSYSNSELFLARNPFVTNENEFALMEYEIGGIEDTNTTSISWGGIKMERVSLPLSSLTGGNAKDDSDSRSVSALNDKIYDVAEIEPQYPGGLGEILSVIGKNIKYPDYAQYKKIQGRVLVKFVVNTDGSVSNVQVAKGVEPSLDAEAVRVVSLLKGFTPGSIGGMPVNVWYTLPVNFKLN